MTGTDEVSTGPAAKELVDGLGLSADTAARLVGWLTLSRYASERAALEQHVHQAVAGDNQARSQLEDAFAGPLPIGTGGRRGLCGPGPNRVNAVVLRETAHGVHLAVRSGDFGVTGDAPLRLAVAFDTRRDSLHFSRLVSAQLALDGWEVLLLTEPRPTPQLSYLMRAQACTAGIVISASHNPPGDNGIKIYGPDGAQVLGLRDRALMRGILAAGEADLPHMDVGAVYRGEMPEGIEQIDPAHDSRGDAAYHAYVLEQGVSEGSLAGLGVVFTPLHGVGHTSVMPVLRSRGADVAAVERQCDPDDGRFSTVESANPESPAAMDMAVAQARDTGAQLVLACDPDADRLGACVPRGDEWVPIDGNRLGVLMLDHILHASAELPADGWVLTTMVTSPLVGTLARAAGVDVIDDLRVGFKHHAGLVAEQPDRPLIFGCEESHGYIRGNKIRDKDGAIAALLLTECAVASRAEGIDLLARLERIWAQDGYHREKTANLWAQGLTGREAIDAVMKTWRTDPPTEIGGLAVTDRQDRLDEARTRTGSPTRDMPGNVLLFELAAGDLACRLVLRPSGTEPKLKLYALAHGNGGLDAAALDASRTEVDALAQRVLDDAQQRARKIMAPILEG